MKVTEVPQDLDPSYEGGKRLCYAVDESGKIVEAHSSGWQVEETVKSLAWKVINQELAATRLRVRAGRASNLEYFMKRRQMDPHMLALNMGISKLRVYWHLRPRVFRNLNEAWLRQYSSCLEIPVEQLRNYRGEGDV
jgi:hypothetical protein